MKRLVIATRRSRLALWQAEHVKARLEALHAGLAVALSPMSTRGDELQDRRLDQAGGKGLFVKELEAAMAEGRPISPCSAPGPSYVEDSWITQDLGYGPIRLIPRMRDRIAAHYPGTGLAITEWNYGGGQHISGALATADALRAQSLSESADLVLLKPIAGGQLRDLALRFRPPDPD